MPTPTFAPSASELKRTPLPLTIAEKDPEQTRKVKWKPQKMAAMMFSAGLLDGALFGDDEQGQAKAGTQATKGMLDWFAGGLSAADEEWLIGRLKDADDWFDFVHLNEIVKHCIEVIADRPTTSRSG